MTKARDLASATPVPSAVSATELGYVDGVTSAIQTQVDSKLATTTASSTYIPKTLTTTTGDVIYASGANTPARLGIGSTGNVLTVSGGVPTWAAPPAGKILQVIQATNATAISTTTQYPSFATATGFTASITPSSTSSKILVMLNVPFAVVKNANDAGGGIRITRGGTAIYPANEIYSQYVSASGTGTLVTTVHQSYIDSPASTSSLTYGVEFMQSSGSSTAYISFNNQTSSLILMEIGA